MLNLSMYMCSYQDGKTALHFASWQGHLAVVTVLVDGGADLNIQEKVSTRIGCVYKQIRMNMNITRNVLYMQHNK